MRANQDPQSNPNLLTRVSRSKAGRAIAAVMVAHTMAVPATAAANTSPQAPTHEVTNAPARSAESMTQELRDTGELHDVTIEKNAVLSISKEQAEEIGAPWQPSGIISPIQMGERQYGVVTFDQNGQPRVVQVDHDGVLEAFPTSHGSQTVEETSGDLRVVRGEIFGDGEGGAADRIDITGVTMTSEGGATETEDRVAGLLYG